jgi:predicted PurR-regulated permease PerM
VLAYLGVLDNRLLRTALLPIQAGFTLAHPRSATDTSRLLGLAASVVIVATLYFAKTVLVPFALAILLSFLLTPLVRWLEKLRLARAPSVILVVVLVVIAAGFVGVEVTNQLVDVTNQLPNYRTNIKKKVASFRGDGRSGLVTATETVNELGKEVAEPPSPSTLTGRERKAKGAIGEGSSSKPVDVRVVPPGSSLWESLPTWLGPVETTAIVLVFTIFILLRREDLRNRFIRLTARGHLNLMTQALDDGSHRISKYLLLQCMVNVSYGVAIGAALYFIGLPNALLWGVLAGAMRFAPYIGPLIGGALPTVLSLAVFDGWTRSFMILGVFLLLEVVVANFIEPMLYGAHTGISSIAILVSAVFWTLLWGPIGLVLSMPLTVCLVVLGRYVPQLEFLQILLGDEPVLTPEMHLYQRLLASDYAEARQVVDDYLQGHSLLELYDQVMIPALGMAERDRHQNDLDEPVERFIRQSSKELVEELNEKNAERKPATLEGQDGSSEIIERMASGLVNVVCVPARDEADETIGAMLAQLLENNADRAQCVSLGTITEMLDQIIEAKPDIVLISTLPPFAMTHARTLYRKIRDKLPRTEILIGVWNFNGETERILARLGPDVRATLVRDLATAIQRVRIWADGHSDAGR